MKYTFNNLAPLYPLKMTNRDITHCRNIINDYYNPTDIRGKQDRDKLIDMFKIHFHEYLI